MSAPIFDWKFDLASWPHNSFLGRRWMDFHKGLMVFPTNGCIYWWACLWQTLIMLLTPPPVYNKRKKEEAAGGGKYKPMQRYNEVHHEMSPFQIWFGETMHAIFIGKYSPFRLFGVGVRSIVVPVVDFMETWNWKIIGRVASVLSLVASIIFFGILLYFDFWQMTATLGVIIAVVVAVPVFFILIFLIVEGLKSDFVKSGFMMMKAGKNKVCPGITIVDTRGPR